VKSLDYPDNAKIVHVGTLIKQAEHRRWLVSVRSFPKMQERKTDVFSTLPELARGRIVNQSKPVNDDRELLNFTAPDLSNIHETKLSSFHELYPQSSYIESLESDQWAFSVPIVIDGEKINILIPQLELARITVLQFSYLCRAALNSTSLLVDFDVSYDDEVDTFTIDVINNQVFPTSSLQSLGVRDLLAWLLFDNDAMLSFKSIYRNLQKEVSRNNKWDSWLFHFDPPDITGWGFDCLGRYSKDRCMFIVDEIVGVQIGSEMPGKIRYQGKGFVENINHDDVVSTGERFNPPNSNAYDLDADAVPNDEYVEHFSNSSLSLSFKKTFSSEVVREQRFLFRAENRSEGREIDEDVRRGSTGEPTVMGNDKPVSVGVTNDSEEHTRQLKNRFKLFSKVVDALAANKKITVNERDTFEKLGKVGKSRLHQLSDSSTQRSIQSVSLTYQYRGHSKDFIVLEVDVSDGISPLSTLILPAFNEQEWPRIYESIRYELVKNSLKWPKSHLSMMCRRTGREYRTAIHPKSDLLSTTEDDREAVSSWTRHILSKLY
jgi:hypothetical protein